MIELKDVTFTYQTVDADGNTIAKNGVTGMNLTIREGEFLVLTGRSGCGKTTVIRLINGLIPHYYKGDLTGSIEVNGISVPGSPIYETAKRVGSVFQNPRTQFFNVNTTDEIAFAAENQGRDAENIRLAITETAASMGIADLLDRNIFELSGGEKQIIACAGIQVLSPDIIVLDEPSSNLDHHAIKKLREILTKWKASGKTIIVAEHRLFYLRELADRMLILDNGIVKRELSREEIRCLSNDESEKLGIRPVSLEKLKYDENREAERSILDTLTFDNFQFVYKDGRHGIDISRLTVPAGGMIAVIGHNGAGKSTFVRNICGLEKRCKGTMTLSGKKMKAKERIHNCYMIMQDVNHQLFTESVKDEVLLGITEKTRTNASRERQALGILSQLDLAEYAEIHPMALSGGQKQRTAIASGIASSKPVIIFDEPTSGLDLVHMKQVADEIKKLQKMGKTIFVVTHDYEFILNCCDYVVWMEDGTVCQDFRLNTDTVSKLNDFFHT